MDDIKNIYPKNGYLFCEKIESESKTVNGLVMTKTNNTLGDMYNTIVRLHVIKENTGIHVEYEDKNILIKEGHLINLDDKYSLVHKDNVLAIYKDRV